MESQAKKTPCMVMIGTGKYQYGHIDGYTKDQDGNDCAIVIAENAVKIVPIHLLTVISIT